MTSDLSQTLATPRIPASPAWAPSRISSPTKQSSSQLMLLRLYCAQLAVIIAYLRGLDRCLPFFLSYTYTHHSIPAYHTPHPPPPSVFLSQHSLRPLIPLTPMTSSHSAGLPSSVCGSANDSTYASTDRSSIRSSGQASITSSSTGKPKRSVRFQDPVPVEPEVQSAPSVSLTSLDLSSDDSSYGSRSRQSSSASSSIAAGKQPIRSASPRFGRPLSLRPSLGRNQSVTSTASAPGELEFTDWLARMEQSRSPRDPRDVDHKGKDARKDVDKEDRKKKRRSWVNLLVR